MEVVVSVADAGGSTAAARQLSRVQSAVPSSVRALERELATPCSTAPRTASPTPGRRGVRARRTRGIPGGTRRTGKSLW
ncbi:MULTISPECIES: LysR family transcriptional regulator [unclassified Streptomyces]|nr:LysR family transcriptional regulator [Streptomyces sp. NBC_00589]WTI42955.1 LysR family transcriptional regulator [Streptomyces sp. NBC_00775]WUB32830.1 LysR family transcriptional regulator [Streptomyces sp. NBC_00589]